MREITLDELIDLLGEVVDFSGVEINQHMVLGEDIPVDSSDMLRILSRIESRYKFRFKLGEVLNLKTLGDILEVVRHNANTG